MQWWGRHLILQNLWPALCFNQLITLRWGKIQDTYNNPCQHDQNTNIHLHLYFGYLLDNYFWAPAMNIEHWTRTACKSFFPQEPRSPFCQVSASCSGSRFRVTSGHGWNYNPIRTKQIMPNCFSTCGNQVVSVDCFRQHFWVPGLLDFLGLNGVSHHMQRHSVPLNLADTKFKPQMPGSHQKSPNCGNCRKVPATSGLSMVFLPIALDESCMLKHNCWLT